MSINREEIKRMIDNIPDHDAAEVLDFIGYLNMKREREEALLLNVDALAEDEGLIHQVQKSREDRKAGRTYDEQAGLEYLKGKIEDLERGQNL